MSYSTCALLHAKGDSAGSQLNPFALHEYDEHCKATSSTSLRSVCVVGAGATAHMADHVAKGVEAACVQKGRYVLDAKCMSALLAAPDAPAHRSAGPTEPLFAEASVCRSKLSGTFAAKCGGREVTFDELRTAVGAGCEQCCETVVRDEAKRGGHGSHGGHGGAHKASGEHGGHGGGHGEHGEHSKHTGHAGHMPAYVPFQV